MKRTRRGVERGADVPGVRPCDARWRDSDGDSDSPLDATVRPLVVLCRPEAGGGRLLLSPSHVRRFCGCPYGVTSPTNGSDAVGGSDALERGERIGPVPGCGDALDDGRAWGGALLASVDDAESDGDGSANRNGEILDGRSNCASAASGARCSARRSSPAARGASCPPPEGRDGGAVGWCGCGGASGVGCPTT